MTTIDFVQLFEERGVHYTRVGQHKANNIGINCPLCAADGDPDPSEHLGIDLENGYWNCWRNSGHRGKHPAKLLWAVLGMSRDEVEGLLGQRAPQSDFDAFVAKADPFAMPGRFHAKRLAQGSLCEELPLLLPLTSPLCADHLAYLLRRGIFKPRDDLRGGVMGAWASRVIFPIYSEEIMVTWTGRKISEAVSGPKYKTLRESTSLEDRFGGMSIKQCLYDEHILGQSDTVIVVEGVLDAENLRQYVKADVTCVFGVSITQEQLAKLWSFKYKRIIFMFDADAYPQAVKLAADIGGEAISVADIGVSDPGDIRDIHTDKLIAHGL